MKKTLLLSMLLFFLTTLASFARMDGDPILPTYKIVIIPGDTIGDPEEIIVYDISAGSNLVLENYTFPKRGYELDRWESVKGLSLENIISDDTIIVYFKPSPMYYITVISSDTSMGSVGKDSSYFEEEKVYLNPQAKAGYKYVYWYSTSDPTVKHSGTTFLAYRTDTIVCQFIQSSESGPYKIVALSSDTTKGYVTPINDSIQEGSRIPLTATPNRGYKLDHWESVKGLPYDYAKESDTIYAYFDTLPSYYIVALSNDTTLGQFNGSGIFYEGEKLPVTILHDDTFSVIPDCNAFPDSYVKYFISKAKGDTIYNLHNDYKVTCNDTIIAYFGSDTIPSSGNDTLPESGGNEKNPDVYLRVYVYRCAKADLYGNTLNGKYYGYKDSDSLIVTNKRTGMTDTISINNNLYRIAFGDTVSFIIKTDDEFQSDSVYTLAYTDPTYNKYIYVDVYLYGPDQKFEFEEAEGDSFNVNIRFERKLYDSALIEIYSWEGNGRYAKGDTIFFEKYHLNYYSPNSLMTYELPNRFVIVVNNNIDLKFFTNDNDYMIDVEQVIAEESVVDPYVNVYSINGYLVKQHVLKENALDGLSKGLYIVGRKKVYVK